MNRIFLVLIIVLYSVSSFGQEIPDLITDRPDQTESSVTIPHKTFQIETGFLYQETNYQGSILKELIYNSTLLRYGLFENLELRASSSVSKSDFRNSENEIDSTKTGLSPLSLGFKINIVDQKGVVPQLAFLANFNIPKTGAKYVRVPNLSNELKLLGSWGITDRIGAGFNIGMIKPGDSPKTEGYYSIVFSYSISNSIGAFIEGYGIFSGHDLPDNRMDAGITWRLRHNLQLDLSGGWGLSEQSPDYFVSCGLSWRIPR